MATTHDEYLAQDRPPCPHFEEDCEWQNEFWTGLKTTGYEHRVCRNCGLHVERRPQSIFTEKLTEAIGGPHDFGFVFDKMAEVLAELDQERFEDTLNEAKGFMQEVKDGKSNSKDASPA